MAVVKANNLLEDASQVEAGPFVAEGVPQKGPCGTFIGVNDAHGGPETARFLADSLARRLKEYELPRTVWADVVVRKTDASSDRLAEEAYENFVRKRRLIQPRIVSAASYVCVDVIWEGVFYIAKDAGNSLVVEPPKISRSDQLAERRQDVAHKTRSTRLNRKTEKRDTRLNRKTEKW